MTLGSEIGFAVKVAKLAKTLEKTQEFQDLVAKIPALKTLYADIKTDLAKIDPALVTKDLAALLPLIEGLE